MTSDRDEPTEVVPRRSLVAGARLGRYFVLGLLGSGAYGEVYRAYDPRLDRKVAIKLLRPDRTLAGERRVALLGEAQALAKLSHPAVVALFEVIDTEVGMALAMELVDGTDLARWLATAPSWQDAVDVVVAAGRGLAAAHAAGIVHRDFKPANVLLGTDRRARVVDFGLAQFGELDPTMSTAGDARTAVTGSSETRLAAGTPPYMAPELFAGAPASAATDQYAFFVTLYEAIFRAHPWQGTTAAELTAAKATAPVIPATPRIPRWLRRALEAGLAPAPEARPPDLSDAIAKLERNRGRGRSWLGAAVIAAATIAVAAVAIQPSYAHWRSCAATASIADSSWNVDRRERARTAMVAASPLLGAESYPVIERELDERLVAWRTAYDEGCRAASTTDEGGARTLDPGLRCLRQQLFVIDAWVDALGQADPETIERALPAIAALPRASACTRMVSREGFAPVSDPDLLEQIDGLRRVMARLDTRLDAGDLAGTQGEADMLLAQAQNLGHEPLVAEAMYLRGRAVEAAGDLHLAVTQLESTMWLSERIRHDRLVVRTAIHLTALTGVRLQQPSQARLWTQHGDAMLRRGAPDPELEVELLARQAEVDALDHHTDDSERALRRALELAARVHGPDHLVLAELWSDLGGVASSRAAYDEADEPLRRALEIRRARLPPHHPALVSTLHNLAVAAQQRGRFGEARDGFLEVLRIDRDRLGPRHVRTAMTFLNLGSAELGLEAYTEAEAHTREAATIVREAVGADHPHVAIALVNLGQIRFARGDEAGALESTYAGIAQLEHINGPDHGMLVQPWVDAAILHRERGEPERAIEALERARTIDLGSDDDDETLWAYYAAQIAAVAATAGDTDAAITGFADALAAMELERAPEELEVIETQLGLAHAWRAQGWDAEALRLARGLADLPAQGSGDARLVVADAHGLVAELARAVGDEAEATRHERMIPLALDGDAARDRDRVDARLALARALWRRGRHLDAIRQLTQLHAACATVSSAACTRASTWARAHGLAI